MLNEETREKLADLEHRQWMSWTKYLVENHDIPEELEEKWKKNWEDYENLSEEEKDKDRKWADKAVAIVENSLKDDTSDTK